MKLDPQAILASITVPGAGWQHGRIVHRNGPRRPFEGLIDPDGAAWEVFDVPTKQTELRHFAKRVRNQQAAGYSQAIVTIEGRTYLAERYRDNIKPWDGLDLVGYWENSSGDVTYQHSVEGAFRGIRVALYIRWRDEDPWTGNVILLPPDANLAFLPEYPWSPNLLPKDRPLPPSAEPLSLRNFLDQPKCDPWITEDETHKAKNVLIERADLWLCEHVDDPKAWDNK